MLDGGGERCEVARIARMPRAETVSVLGLDVSLRAGAWAFCLLTVITAAMLAAS